MYRKGRSPATVLNFTHHLAKVHSVLAFGFRFSDPRAWVPLSDSAVGLKLKQISENRQVVLRRCWSRHLISDRWKNFELAEEM